MQPSSNIEPAVPSMPSSGPLAWRHIVLCILLLTCLPALWSCDRADSDELLARAAERRASGDLRGAVVELKSLLQRDPDNWHARALLGALYLELGAAPAAEKELVRARELGHENLDTFVMLLRARLLAGEYDRVIKDIVASKVRNTQAQGNADVLQVLLGQAKLGTGQVEGAREAFDAASESPTAAGEANAGLAIIEAMAGNADQANRYIDLATAASPNHPDVLRTAGDVAFQQGDFETARDRYRQAIESGDHTGQARAGFVHTLLALNDSQRAGNQIKHLAREFGTDHPLVNYLRALTAQQDGDLQTAKTALLAALSKDPGHAPSRLLLGVVHLALSEFEQGRAQLATYVNEHPDNIDARKLLAVSELRLGQTESAIKTLLPALDQEPNNPGVLGMLGNIYLRSGDLDDGMLYLQRAAAQEPASGTLRAQLGVAQMRAGKLDEALAELHSAAADENFSGADVVLVLKYLQLEEFDKAREAVQSLIDKRPESPVGYNLLGLVHARMGRPDEARSAYEKALEIDQNFYSAAMNLARLDLKQGNVEQARARFETIAAKDIPLAVNAGLVLARMDLLAGDNESARARYTALLESHGDNATVHAELGKILMLSGRRDEARAAFERANELDVGALEPKLFLVSLYLHGREPQRALAAAREAHRLAPRHAGVLLALGQALRANDLHEEAQETLMRLVKGHPDSGNAHYELALTQIALERWQPARNSLERALELGAPPVAVRTALVRAELGAGKLEQAERLARALVRAPGGSREHALLGEVLERAGQPAAAEQSYRAALELDAAYVDASLALARLELAKGRLGDALNTLTSRGAQATDPRLAIAAASVALAQGDTARARTHLDVARRLAPDSGDVMTLEARIEALAGQPSMAVAQLERVREADPRAVEPRIALSRYYLATGDLGKARMRIDEAARLAPENPAVVLQLGEVELAGGKLAQAITTLSKARSLAPESLQAHLSLAEARRRAGDTDLAREVLHQAADLDRDGVVARTALAQLELDAERHDVALELAAAIEHESDGSGIAAAIKGAALAAQGESGAAIEAYARSLAERPRVETALALFGLRLEHEGLDGAEIFAREWLSTNPHDHIMRAALADALGQAGKTGAAIAEYELLLDAQPGNVRTLNNLAVLYHDAADARALPTAERAFELAPQNPAVLDTYGWLLVQSGKVERGISILSKITGEAASDPTVRYHLAAALFRAGEHDAARRKLEGLELADFPEKPEALRLLDDLN